MDHIPRILIAEDENIIAKDIEKTLKKLGYEVVKSVRSGEQLLEEYPLFKPDLDINGHKSRRRAFRDRCFKGT